MEPRRILIAVILTSFVALTLAGDGTTCSAPVNANGMESFDPHATLYGGSTFSERYDARDFASGSHSKAIGLTKGVCHNWNDDLRGQDVAQPPIGGVHYLLWNMGSNPDVKAFIQLTTPHSTDTWATRLMVVSVANSITDANVCATGSANAWECEAMIIDSCQGYGETGLRAYTFKTGRKYVFILDTPSAPPAQLLLNLIPVPVQTQTFQTGFEDATAPGFSTPGAFANGWTKSTNSGSRGWDAYAVSNEVITVPGYAGSAWEDANGWAGVKADTRLIGGVGTRVAAVIPDYNPKTNGEPIDPCSGVDLAAGKCDHTNDVLTSPWYQISVITDPTLQIETFFNDLSDDDTPASCFGDVYASIDGTTWTHIHTMTTIFEASWGVDVIDLSDVVTSSTTQVQFRFVFRSADNQCGWILNNIAVNSKDEFDTCNDGFSCTLDRCANFDGPGFESIHFGCYNPDNGYTCQSQVTDCIAKVCDPTSDKPLNVDGCYDITDPSLCDDERPCTKDICHEDGHCENQPREYLCNDGKGCTEDFCLRDTDPHADQSNEEGCYFEANCDDQVDCTDDSCEEAALGGDKCLHRINFDLCEDFIDCTYELVCDPEQPGFDPVSGCIRIPMDEWCNDYDPCTIDTCEPYSEEAGRAQNDRCVNKEIDCDDCIPCTFDHCEEGECVNDAIDEACDDGIPCTDDVCNKELGKCENIPRDDWCYGHEGLDACDIFTCRPHQLDSNEWGCVAKVKDCDDDLACTHDECVDGDCVFEAHDEECYDGPDRCTDDYCSKTLHKCVNLPNSENCDDENVCTINFCGRDGRCHFPEIDCSDDIHCTLDSCDPEEGCYSEAVNSACDDEIDCTEDACDVNLGGCTNIPSHAWCTKNRDKCHTWFCNSPSGDEGGCYGIPIDCEDGIPCTEDSCTEEGACIHVPNKAHCDDGHNCTVDMCDEYIGCINLPDNDLCNDGNLCTTDICGCDGECYHHEEACDDQIACTIDYCDPADGMCKITIPENACDDGIECTADECSLTLGRCTNIPLNSRCTDTSECTHGVCSIVPEDANADSNGCFYPRNHSFCDDHIPCTDDICLPGLGGCQRTPYDSLCNDGLGCTQDSCNVALGGCFFDPIQSRCDDGFNCTSDFCSTVEDCINIPMNDSCEDNVGCTLDWCAGTAGENCRNDPMDEWCSDGIACTVDTCTPGSGEDNCHHEAVDDLCNDYWDCTDDYCDKELGRCRYVLNDCPWQVQTDALCIECQSGQAQILQLNYTDGTGALQFATKNSTSDSVRANIVALPTDQVLIGAASQEEVHVGKYDGLVLNDNLRLVPHEKDAVLPTCNEIRRGTLIVVQKAESCGDGHTCHRDQILLCSKQQDYEWVPLGN